jgi:hypothetical protein
MRNFFSAVVLALGLIAATGASASDDPLFHSTDALAPRDEWGVFHQTPVLYSTDFISHSGVRFSYYLRSGRELLKDPSYVAVLQVSLRNRGYYCGPIDGIASDEVSEAIARLQKNYAQRVTGHLSIPVRRALNLP